MITVNGKAIESPIGLTIESLLGCEGFNPERVVIELNGAIVKKDMHASTALNDGDIIEILQFVGGG